MSILHTAHPLLPTFAGSHQDIAPLLNQIYHCDAFELLARLPDASVDMALLDLPYGVTACKWDTPLPLEPLWEELKRICKPRAAMVFTATQPFTSRLVSSNYEMFRYEWVWLKNNSTGFSHAYNMPMRNHESIVIFSSGTIQHGHLTDSRMTYFPQDIHLVHKSNRRGSKGFSGTMERLSQKNVYITEFTGFPRTVISFPIAQNTVHPTQKPVALFEYLIKTYTQEHEIVLDFVCGSGTTAIAARKCNRQFICGDITQEYVEIARKRLKDSDPYQSTELDNGMKQLSLFEETA